MAPCPPERRRQQGVRGAELIRVVSCRICRPSSHQVSQMRMVPSLAAGAGAGVPLFSRRQEDGSKGSALRGMVPSPAPKRDHGDPQAFRLRSARARWIWCGRRDLNPHGPCGPTDFRTRLRLSPPPLSCRRVLGLDYPFTVSRMCFRLSGAARLVSTPSRPECSGRAWLGIAMLQGSPNLSSSASPVSLRALKFALKSDASADSATPA